MQLFLFLTIAWRETPDFQNRDDQWDELQRRVFVDLHSFCHARQIPLAYIWVRERKPGIGAHTHVLLHLGHSQIRPRIAVARLKAYMRRRYGFGSRGLHFGWKPDARARFDRLAYLLKAMDPGAFRYVGLDQQHLTEALGLTHYTDRQQGKIRLQRYGMSRNLARNARAECCDWREMRDLDAYRRALHEPYFALLQRNVLERRRWTTREELRIAIVTWIERTYHHRRKQTALGRLTPAEYELTMTPKATQAA
jgi:transposase InsO family protein